MCWRGGEGKTGCWLKGGLALQSIPSNAYAADSACGSSWFWRKKLLVNLQVETGAVWQRLSGKRTVRRLLPSVQTICAVLLRSAALLVRPQAALVLLLTEKIERKRALTPVNRDLARRDHL